MSRVGLTREQVAESIDKWLAYGLQLCRLFQVNELYLTVPEKVRFYHYYVPVFLWCEDQIAKHQAKFKDVEDVPPLVVCRILALGVLYLHLLRKIPLRGQFERPSLFLLDADWF